MSTQPDKSKKRSRIPIVEGERLSKKFDAPVVIIFTIMDKGDTFNVTTYGASKALCRHAASLGNQIVEKVLNGTIVPEQVEPLHLPTMPMNWESNP